MFDNESFEICYTIDSKIMVVFCCLCWGWWLDIISFLELGVKSKAFQ